MRVSRPRVHIRISVEERLNDFCAHVAFHGLVDEGAAVHHCASIDEYVKERDASRSHSRRNNRPLAFPALLSVSLISSRREGAGTQEKLNYIGTLCKSWETFTFMDVRFNSGNQRMRYISHHPRQRNISRCKRALVSHRLRMEQKLDGRRAAAQGRALQRRPTVRVDQAE